jgi:hypothetical protein
LVFEKNANFLPKIAKSPQKIDPRLGEFSHTGQWFTFDSFLKITEVAQIFLATFFIENVVINFDKICCGVRFRRFFFSSGHPAPQPG